MRKLAILLCLCGCHHTAPQGARKPGLSRPAPPHPTTEQCEQVVEHLADLEVAQQPAGAQPETLAAMKKYIVAQLIETGFLATCKEGYADTVACLLSAKDKPAINACQ